MLRCGCIGFTPGSETNAFRGCCSRNPRGPSLAKAVVSGGRIPTFDVQRRQKWQEGRVSSSAAAVRNNGSSRDDITCLDTVRKELAAQVREEWLRPWGGDSSARRLWWGRAGAETHSSTSWQQAYRGLLAVVQDVDCRRGAKFTLAEAERLVQSARTRHGPDSLEMGRVLGATGLALMAGQRPGWRNCIPLLAEADRVHKGWLGSRHCAVFMLNCFQGAARVLSSMPRLSLADVNQMLATVVANSGPDSSEMGDALAQCGLALLLVGNIQPGRVLLRRAAEVKASLLGPGNHIPNICVALSDEPLLWKIC